MAASSPGRHCRSTAVSTCIDSKGRVFLSSTRPFALSRDRDPGDFPFAVFTHQRHRLYCFPALKSGVKSYDQIALGRCWHAFLRDQSSSQHGAQRRPCFLRCLCPLPQRIEILKRLRCLVPAFLSITCIEQGLPRAGSLSAIILRYSRRLCRRFAQIVSGREGEQRYCCEKWYHNEQSSDYPDKG